MNKSKYIIHWFPLLLLFGVGIGLTFLEKNAYNTTTIERPISCIVGDGIKYDQAFGFKLICDNVTYRIYDGSKERTILIQNIVNTKAKAVNCNLYKNNDIYDCKIVGE